MSGTIRMTEVIINPDDFNIKVWQKDGRLYFNVWIHGKKAVPFLSQLDFKDENKKWRKKLLLEQIDNFTH